MKYYEVIVPFAQVAGRLHLTDAQAAARAHLLTRLEDGDNRFATTAPALFKRGEVLGMADAPGKGAGAAFAEKKIDFERFVKSERARAVSERRGRAEERARREAEVKKRQLAKEAVRLEREREARADAERRQTKARDAGDLLTA